jgi:hypothetical protein
MAGARKQMDRPPRFQSRATLAAELDMPESKIAKLVARGVIPKPLDLGGNTLRWDWQQVCSALSADGGGAALTEDPYLVGARNATSAR